MSVTSPRVREKQASLTFAWTTCEGDGARLCLATLLALLVFGLAGMSLRIVVPSSIAKDGRHLPEAQLLVVNADTDPSVLRLLAKNEVPSLAVEEAVGEAPLIDDLLAQLGLTEQEASAIDLYPTPHLAPILAWPRQANANLTLPPLPKVVEQAPIVQKIRPWRVRLTAAGSLAELFGEAEFPWPRGGGRDPQREFFVTVDPSGRTVVASLLGEAEPAMEADLRRLWERHLAGRMPPQEVLSGVVAVEFFQKAEDEG